MKHNYTFENFFVHDGNRVAFTAAKKIVDFPGEVFNPFYIYGVEGYGKTHLLAALSDALGKKSRVEFLTVQEFEGELVKHRTFNSPLIVDDIHEIKENHKKRLREIVEDALSHNVQLCFSSLVPPQQVGAFSQKLCSLMESGLVCELTAPDKAVRIEIIRSKADEAGIILADETLEELARIATGSVGTIENMIRRLVAYSSLGNLSIDANSIGLILKEFYPRKAMRAAFSVLEESRREDLWSLGDVESPHVQKEYERRVAVWEMKGFDVSALKKQSPEDSLDLRRVYHEYVKRAQRMIELQSVFAKVNREQAPVEALKIDSMIYDPANLEEVERLLKVFDKCVGGTRVYRKFNEFIIGFCNKFVWDTYHDKVLDNLGANNPFVIFGNEGTGKSHFLEAMCDDLISRGKKVLFEDLSCPVEADLTVAVKEYDIVVMDNFHAILEASESVINDIGELFDAFRKASKQIIIASLPISEDIPLPAALNGVLDKGVVAVMEKPSADVVNEYIKRHMESDATGVIEQGFPEFDSFYDIAYYLESVGDDTSAVVPLGLPGEEGLREPSTDEGGAAVTDREEEKAPASAGFEVVVGGNFMIPEVIGELIEEGF